MEEGERESNRETSTMKERFAFIIKPSTSRKLGHN